MTFPLAKTVSPHVTFFMDSKLSARKIPWICVPLVAQSELEVIRQIARIRLTGKNPDIFEVRLDYFNDLAHLDVTALFSALAEACPTVPLLATFRSKEQGGAQAASIELQQNILKQAILSGKISLVDIELQMTGYFPELLPLAQQHNVLTVVSQHDFAATPAPDELIRLLQEMAATGADVVKLAVMPQNPADCLNLLAATYQAKQSFLKERLLVTMAMGALGGFTRLATPFFGGCMSFAVGEQSSAPGQLEIDTLTGLWENWGVRSR